MVAVFKLHMVRLNNYLLICEKKCSKRNHFILSGQLSDVIGFITRCSQVIGFFMYEWKFPHKKLTFSKNVFKNAKKQNKWEPVKLEVKNTIQLSWLLLRNSLKVSSDYKEMTDVLILVHHHSLLYCTNHGLAVDNVRKVFQITHWNKRVILISFFKGSRSKLPKSNYSVGITALSVGWLLITIPH